MKIGVFDSFCVNPGDMNWEGLKEFGEFEVYDRISKNNISELAADVEIILTNKTIIKADLMDQLPKLKYIGVLATGYNTVDIAAAKQRGIIVANVPAYSTNSVAQMVFAHLLNITQQVAHYAIQAHEGVWTRQSNFCYSDTEITELHGLKLGIVGYGNIGEAVARIAIEFGMQVYAYTHKSPLQLPTHVKPLPLDDLFVQCDVVSLHCPLTDKNRGMVNAEILHTMKPNAILINTSRGGLLNEQDVADALNGDVIAAAGMDVLSHEPPRIDNPLLTAKNCYITPHIAWATKSARNRLLEITLQNIREFVNGKTVINNVAK
jgi:glycerate dehydrogenase